MREFRTVLVAWVVILCGFWVVSVAGEDDGWGEWEREAPTKRFILTLQQAERTIACMKSVVMVVNGTYVGPTLEVDEGDNVEVLVLNKMNNLGATIHFHGLSQRGTPWADGTAYVSQCPIPPLSRFTYRFNADKAGTFWYHGHQLLSFTSGYGSFIVHPKEKKYDYDEDAGVVAFGNQYMESVQGLIVGLKSNPFAFPGNPQALLANGKGLFNCTAFSECLTCTFGDDCRHEVMYLEPDTKYLLRFTNAGILSFLTLGIQGIPMKVVQTNTGTLKPFKTDFLDLGNGQSYSVVIKTPKERGHYWLQAVMRFRENEGIIPARVLLDTTTSQNYPKETPSVEGFPSTDDVQFSRKFMNKLKSNNTANLNPEYDQLWTLVSSQTKYLNSVKWSLNNYTFQFPGTPALLANQYGVDLRHVSVSEPEMPYDYFTPLAEQGLSEFSNLGGTRFSPKAAACLSAQISRRGVDSVLNATSVPHSRLLTQHILACTITTELNMLTAEYGQRVRVVLQNGLNFQDESEAHPFHMHGGDYWVLGPEMPYDYFTPLAEQGLSEFSNLELNMLTAEYGQRVRVVLQNGLNFQDESEAHPFHMHGGDYWVLGRGQGIFDPEKDMEKLNFENPPLQSTTSVLPFGWTVIEFLADNPGFWLLHCHIGLHSAMGMGLVIAIAPEMIPDIPGNHHICGEVTVNKVLKRNNCEARRPIIHLE
eukprot:CAMPEP_0184752096 /NCGR_PEP_ID=MMETSP0315-20130426/43399_1 /TAXON_ID=101924 /ORGANISM="Rhodosorus marinus, Strain UTEX LB 2760" /LENGTH=702 /DNA_ID=CAMNT_0027231413 /DNA_START=294 /DNA_END=2403 /DNA_ORIENTATION=+